MQSVDRGTSLGIMKSWISSFTLYESSMVMSVFLGTLED